MCSRSVLYFIGIPCSGHAARQPITTGELEISLPGAAPCGVLGSATGDIGTALLDAGAASLLLNAIDADLGPSDVDAFDVHCNPSVASTVTFDLGQKAVVVADGATKRTGQPEAVACQIYSDAGRARVLTSVAGTGTSTPHAFVCTAGCRPRPRPHSAHTRMW